MSIIRQIVDSIADTLRAHDYFRTVPLIPVVVEDAKNIDSEIERAMKSAGVMCLVNFVGAETDTPDTPGPQLTQSRFQVTVSEIPSVWRQSRAGYVPSCTEIAEAVLRIIHHTQPFDKEDVALTGGVFIFDGMSQLANDSMLTQAVSFVIPIQLSNTDPTR
jgi:hypothetical protein